MSAKASRGVVRADLEGPRRSVSEIDRVDGLMQRLGLEGDSKVRDFLRENGHVVRLAEEAVSLLRRRFVGAQLQCELVRDEEEPDLLTLVVAVQTDLPYEEAEALYDAFLEEWWLDAQVEANHQFCVYLEYV